MPAGADSDAGADTRTNMFNLGFSKTASLCTSPIFLPSWDTAATGIILNAPEIAVLAAAQCTHLTVYRRPLRGNFIHWR